MFRTLVAVGRDPWIVPLHKSLTPITGLRNCLTKILALITGWLTIRDSCADYGSAVRSGYGFAVRKSWRILELTVREFAMGATSGR